MAADRGDSLRPRLNQVEDALDKNIETVCDKPSVKEVDTGELIRIEETLAIATTKAKEAVSLRRKMHTQRDAESGER